MRFFLVTTEFNFGRDDEEEDSLSLLAIDLENAITESLRRYSERTAYRSPGKHGKKYPCEPRVVTFLEVDNE